jgi:UDP-N-acetyl-D-glucosamine/UDP-N-acetyl-D-galactosamine dehydrogenase
MNLKQARVAIVGLGYVGLPLAVEFSKTRQVIGFDIDQSRILELQNGRDLTLEVTQKELIEANALTFTSELNDLKKANCFIITVPTPIDELKNPDLNPLIKATEYIGNIIKEGDFIIYESTVYPGVTEDICVPVLEKCSGLKFNKNFYCGYSPERINPGDKNHRLASIVKITSGSTPIAADFVDELYNEIITAGTYKVDSISIAEAAKVIENTQRDINIALINELAIIFDKIGLDTEKVLKAAGSKWNFLPFRPGLVGGHCIGVDPYYLTHKAQSIGYEPKIILSGRKLNDSMAHYIVERVLKLISEKAIAIEKSKVLIMGLSFKENCPDIRNSQVVNIITEMEQRGCNVEVFDPWVNKKVALKEHNMKLLDNPKQDFYDIIVLAVAHKKFSEMGAIAIRKFGNKSHIFMDLKYLFTDSETDVRL